MNKYQPHIYVIPEDDRDRQIADGFMLHHNVDTRRIQVMPPAGGWSNVLKTFEVEYTLTLRNYPLAHVVMLIDFDGRIDQRRAQFQQAIPDEIKDRVFVVGASLNPEALRHALQMRFEDIGRTLAKDCEVGTAEHWNHEQLQHNDAERLRLVQLVRPFLFSAG